MVYLPLYISSSNRQIVKHKNLSKAYLIKDSEIGLWLKFFFGLLFLPPAEVGDAFTELLSIMPADNECVEFADYVLDTYIDEISKFPLIYSLYTTLSPTQTDQSSDFKMSTTVSPTEKATRSKIHLRTIMMPHKKTTTTSESSPSTIPV
ncbi:hypothetical protein QTP88_012109 [Uroleucon formosanum]